MSSRDAPDTAGIDPLALEAQLCFALAATSRRVVNFYREVLGPLGLTHPQYLVMLALWESSPRRFGDVAAALMLDPATLSPLLKRLESMGLIARAKSHSDDRVTVVQLTDSGVELRSKALAIPERLGRELQLEPEYYERLRDDLATLAGAVARAESARSDADTASSA